MAAAASSKMARRSTADRRCSRASFRNLHRRKSLVRRALAVVAVAALVACTHNNFMPNVIQLTPSGSSASPAPEPITKSFTLIAVEDGYTGEFTAQVTTGDCWVVQTPVTTSGAWTVVPQGPGCSQNTANEIKVKDQKGNSAVTYVRPK